MHVNHPVSRLIKCIKSLLATSVYCVLTDLIKILVSIMNRVFNNSAQELAQIRNMFDSSNVYHFQLIHGYDS